MKNGEVAELLDRLGDLAEANGEDRFKVVAYHRAATSVRNLDEDVELVWREGRLEDIRFIGEGISKKIDEYLTTGRLRLLEKLEEMTPPGVTLLTRVQGIGPRTAYHLSHDLGIDSVDKLKEALESGRLDREFGPTVRASFREGIERLASYGKRMLIPEAEGEFRKLESYFEALGISVRMAGSLRRGRGTVGDLDLLSTDPRVLEAIKGCPGIAEVVESGPRRASVKQGNGVQVDVRLFTKEECGAALLYFTGSKDHSIAMRNLAIEKGWKLNEYGLFDREGRRRAGETEEGVYQELGMEYIPPELRENRGEIEASLEHRLPALLEFDDIRGDLQMHTTWSDGSEELEAMALAAKGRGYEYIAVTDHSVSVRVANGLTEERFRRQWKEIDRLNELLAPFTILKGVEVEIRNDGSLDFDREFLDEFDVVGASLHQNFKQDPERLTERVLKALAHPSVDFLCHPTNRLIGRREGNPIDLVRVIKAAKDNGKMLEVDGQPKRLDLDELWAKKAIEEGVPLVIDSDAHSVGELDNVGYGVTVARRGWVQADGVANAGGLKALVRLVS
ncbi:MAG: DNA polymerase/3'-5' exonuclease PolX [Nitrososphaerota archaeon]|nr:DNA polymerase/3'-5' exonuclease PolX [Nitrososphaerota archaeon]